MSNDLGVLFKNIANEIRAKLGTQQSYRPSTFPELIKYIPSKEGNQTGIIALIQEAENIKEKISINSLIQEAENVKEKISINSKILLSIKNFIFSIVGNPKVGETISVYNQYIEEENCTYQWKRGIYERYIESTGSQYIDTGIIPLSGYTVKIDFQPQSSTNNKWIYGLYSSVVFEAGIYGNQFYTGGSFTYSQNSLLTRTLATGKCTNNCNKTALLFARNLDNNLDNMSAKIFSCKTYNQNGELIQDLRPAISTEEGHLNEVCMIDLITNTYFYNQGSGIFSIKAEVIKTEPIENEISSSYLIKDGDVSLQCTITGKNNYYDSVDTDIVIIEEENK